MTAEKKPGSQGYRLEKGKSSLGRFETRLASQLHYDEPSCPVVHVS
ncbi:hypothetical protein [Pseudodesulfovibrio piezophilus]|nr:hypothetical protein [Pseudodesulfovibrio piezophilus]